MSNWMLPSVPSRVLLEPHAQRRSACPRDRRRLNASPASRSRRSARSRVRLGASSAAPSQRGARDGETPGAGEGAAKRRTRWRTKVVRTRPMREPGSLHHSLAARHASAGRRSTAIIRLRRHVPRPSPRRSRHARRFASRRPCSKRTTSPRVAARRATVHGDRRSPSAPARRCVVTGANGRGKTTLLRMLAGLTLPEAGEIRLDGVRVAPRSRRRCAPPSPSPATRSRSRTSCPRARTWRRSSRCPVRAPDDATSSMPRSSASRSASGPIAAGARRCRRDSVAASASRASRCRAGACGSSTSRSPRSTPPAPRCSRSWSRAHLDRGGLAVASTHAPLALPPARARTLSLD